MRRIPLIALLAALLAFGAAACGNETDREALPSTVEGSTFPESGATDTGTAAEGGGAVEGDPAAGKQVFASAGCASCHTLADAGATGQVGPNLDDAKPAYDLVIDRVTNGAGAMPSFKDSLSEDDIKNVAAYVVQATSGG
jgi:sulfite dehydrogenase